MTETKRPPGHLLLRLAWPAERPAVVLQADLVTRLEAAHCPRAFESDAPCTGVAWKDALSSGTHVVDGRVEDVAARLAEALAELDSRCFHQMAAAAAALRPVKRFESALAPADEAVLREIEGTGDVVLDRIFESLRGRADTPTTADAKPSE